MGDKSAIEWTQATWNPIVGCSVISPGCTHCYAMKMARRIELMGTAPHYAALTQDSKAGAVWTGKLAQAPDDILFAPLRKKKPTTWFVNSMSDLFHEAVPDAWIDRVFAVMALCPQHTFQVLTKRSARMRQYLTKPNIQNRLGWSNVVSVMNEWFPGWNKEPIDGPHRSRAIAAFTQWPLPNLWLGVSVEDQKRADERIPDLVETPAAVRFLSMEPLLEDVDISQWVWNFVSCKNCPGPTSEDCCRDPGIEPSKLQLVIIGGESGPRARPFNITWARNILDNGRESGVKHFVKQLGAKPYWDLCNGLGKWPDHVRFNRTADTTRGHPALNHQVDQIVLRDSKGGLPEEWPEDLRVREMPDA